MRGINRDQCVPAKTRPTHSLHGGPGCKACSELIIQGMSSFGTACFATSRGRSANHSTGTASQRCIQVKADMIQDLGHQTTTIHRPKTSHQHHHQNTKDIHVSV